MRKRYLVTFTTFLGLTFSFLALLVKGHLYAAAAIFPPVAIFVLLALSLYLVWNGRVEAKAREAKKELLKEKILLSPIAIANGGFEGGEITLQKIAS